eukprot:1279172-Pleurochrysis_carterae.AAC.3
MSGRCERYWDTAIPHARLRISSSSAAKLALPIAPAFASSAGLSFVVAPVVLTPTCASTAAFANAPALIPGNAFAFVSLLSVARSAHLCRSSHSPFQVFDHKVLARELEVVRKVIDHLAV